MCARAPARDEKSERGGEEGGLEGSKGVKGARENHQPDRQTARKCKSWRARVREFKLQLARLVHKNLEHMAIVLRSLAIDRAAWVAGIEVGVHGQVILVRDLYQGLYHLFTLVLRQVHSRQPRSRAVIRDIRKQEVPHARPGHQILHRHVRGANGANL